MELYFLRHGEAAERDGWNGRDFDRPLTDRGRKRMKREAKMMDELALAFDVILTSPLVRAKETAAIVAEGLGLSERVVEDPRLGGDFSPAHLADILSEQPGAGSILLVGHEPSLGETLGELVGGARIAFKKGGLAFVDLPAGLPRRGELVWLLPPKILAR